MEGHKLNLTTVLVSILFPLCLACEDSTGPQASELEGTYALATVNGQEVPFTEQLDSDCSIAVQSGQLRLTVNEWEWSQTAELRCGQSTVDFSYSEVGTFIRAGNSVDLLDEEGDSLEYITTWDGEDQIMVDEDDGGDVFVFRR